MPATPIPDRIIVLIDINDPLTRDKDFCLSIKYSPFVNGFSEISERNRRLITKRDKNKDAAEDYFVRKFTIDVDPNYWTDFFFQFVANPESQRYLSYLDFDTGPLLPPNTDPEEVVAEALQAARDDGTFERARAEGKDMDETVEHVIKEHMSEFEEGLTEVFELRSGEKFKEDPMLRMLNDENPYDLQEDPDDEDAVAPDQVEEAKADPEAESKLDDDTEELELEGNVFVIKPTTRTVH